MSSITPTIGRKIYYVPTLEDIALGMTRQGTTEHLDATVVYVDDVARTVNLRITDHAGSSFVRHGVSVGDEPAPGCAHWMGFQLSQAGVKPEPLTGGSLVAMGSIVDSLARGAEASAIQAAVSSVVAYPGDHPGGVQLQDRSLLLDGVAAQIEGAQAASFAEPGMQTGTEVFGERLSTDSGSAESSQAGVDALQQPVGESAPVVASGVVGD